MGTEIHYCILCFKPLQIADARTGADEHYKKLIKCCEKFLPEEHTNELSKFCIGSPFPFCIVCYSSSQKLYRMNSQLENIYKNLEECINTFSTEISCCRLLYISETQKIRESNVSHLNAFPALPTLKSHPAVEVEVKDEKQDVLEVDIEDCNGCFLDFESDHPDETPEYEEKSNKIAVFDLKPITTSHCKQIFPGDVFPKQLRVTLKRLRFNSKGIIIESRSKYASKTKKRTAAIRAIKCIRSQKLNEEFILGDFKRRRKTTTSGLDDYWTDNNVSEAEFDILGEPDSTDEENGNQTKSGSKRESSKYNCCVCNEEFFNATQLDSHSVAENHLNTKNVACTRCSKTFYKIKDCKQHFRYHSLPTQACPVCGMVFSAYGSYRYHIMSKHRNGNVNQCSICKIKWGSMAALFGHVTTVHCDVKPIECEKCEKVYYTEETFNDHKPVCEWKEGDPAIEDSDRFIITQWTYRSLEDINVRLGPSAPLVRMEGGFKCAECEMYFEISKDLETHSVEFGHVTEKKAVCRYCKRHFYRLRDVYDHKRRCRAFIGYPNNKPIESGEECWKMVSSSDIPPPQDVSQDDNNEISKLTPAMRRAKLYFTCSVCHVIFTLAKQLDDHNEVTGHVNERKYCCPKCPKKYYRGKDLKDHRRKHRRELEKMLKQKQNKSVVDAVEENDVEDSNLSTQFSDNSQNIKTPIECSVCKCKFRLAMHLEAHSTLSGHVNERSIKCTFPECSRMFYRLGDMKIHASEHSFQPTACTICGQTFIKLTNYKKHLGKHQNEKLQNTIRCGLCKIIWLTTKHLKDHMSSEHFNVAPLNCDECEREYYTQEKFDQHMQLHLDCVSKNIPFAEPDEEREWTWQNSDKYKCDLLPPSMEKRRKKGFACLVCGQYFELAKLLDLHSENVGHVNEKSVTCTTCARTFYRIRDLESHRRQSTRCDGLLLSLSVQPEQSSIPT